MKSAAGAKGNYLYERPWYVIIGPPGSGKTTAIQNSGLDFPLVAGRVAGVGGTRNCDWWIAEQAVLIDTAGRYTTQDSDAGADKAGWERFLDLLRRERPRQPLNGVIVAFGADMLSRLDAEGRPTMPSPCAGASANSSRSWASGFRSTSCEQVRPRRRLHRIFDDLDRKPAAGLGHDLPGDRRRTAPPRRSQRVHRAAAAPAGARCSSACRPSADPSSARASPDLPPSSPRSKPCSRASSRPPWAVRGSTCPVPARRLLHLGHPGGHPDRSADGRAVSHLWPRSAPPHRRAGPEGPELFPRPPASRRRHQRGAARCARPWQCKALAIHPDRRLDARRHCRPGRSLCRMVGHPRRERARRTARRGHRSRGGLVAGLAARPHRAERRACPRYPIPAKRAGPSRRGSGGRGAAGPEPRRRSSSTPPSLPTRTRWIACSCPGCWLGSRREFAAACKRPEFLYEATRVYLMLGRLGRSTARW